MCRGPGRLRRKALVDQAVLKGEQSEQEMAVGCGSHDMVPKSGDRSVRGPASGAGPGNKWHAANYLKSGLHLNCLLRDDARRRTHLRGVSLRCDSAAGRKGPAAYPHVPRIRLTPEAGGFDRLSRGLTHRAMLCSAGRSSMGAYSRQSGSSLAAGLIFAVQVST